MFEFKLKAKKGRARRGEFETPHGTIQTPVFMPVGTLGSVKSMAPWELEELGAQIILGNTYHLMLRPGADLIEKAGGLHKWIKWPRPILTDSGGFQVFSLGGRIANTQEGQGRGELKPAKITDKGVEFYSHLDGSKHFLDAKKSIKVQQQLGADIIMAFDECPPGDAGPDYIQKAVERTHRWLIESKKAWTNRKSQALFGIVQGATHKKLREESAEFVNSLDLPGNAIGGVSVGESRSKVWRAVEWSVPHLDENKPRYLMGVGEPADIIEAVNRGCDMFDCVLPTRLARHGVVWVKGSGVGSKKAKLPNGKKFSYKNVDLTASKYREDKSVICKTCKCPACLGGFSRSYVGHLLREKEILGVRLTTLHNLYFLESLMAEIRQSIR